MARTEPGERLDLVLIGETAVDGLAVYAVVVVVARMHGKEVRQVVRPVLAHAEASVVDHLARCVLAQTSPLHRPV